MKREIKFRGIILNGKGWVFGDLVHDTIDAYSRIVKIGIKTKENYPISVIPETAGQYTGLKDKDGKEIYEGDIVTIVAQSNGVLGNIDKKWIGLVFYNELSCQFEIKAKGINGDLMFQFNNRDYNGFLYKHETIGNIHESKTT